MVSNATISAKNGNSAHVDGGCRQKLCVENCSHTTSDSNMVTIDSLFNGTIAGPYDVSFSHAT